MKRLNSRLTFALSVALMFTSISSPAIAASKPKVVINKPGAPTINEVRSLDQRGKNMRVRISFSLPMDTGGSPITYTKVFANGKQICITRKLQCDFNLPAGVTFEITANSRNSKGFGSTSEPVSFAATAINSVPFVDISSVKISGKGAKQYVTFSLSIENRYDSSSVVTAKVSAASRSDVMCSVAGKPGSRRSCRILLSSISASDGEQFEFRAQGSTKNGVGPQGGGPHILIFSKGQWFAMSSR